jgi:uncharacterized protein YcbX
MNRKANPMPVERPITLLSLHLYPVKSCHRIDVGVAIAGERGLQGDREWMVTDAAGRFLTQRSHPGLAAIRPSFEGETLVLRHPRLDPIALPRDGDARWTRRRVRVWDDEVDAAEADPAACAWVSEALGHEARLVRAGRGTMRQPSGPWRGDSPAPVNFPDAYPLLVCNRASLEDLNRRLPDPLPMTRFRPNLVIEGLGPYAEDGIEALQFGPVRLRLVKACTRCSTTTIDQETGFASGNPLPALKAYRFDRALRGVTFGQNALWDRGVGSPLRAGDRGIAVPRRDA